MWQWISAQSVGSGRIKGRKLDQETGDVSTETIIVAIL